MHISGPGRSWCRAWPPLALVLGAGLWPERVVDGGNPLPSLGGCPPGRVGAAPKTRQLSHVPSGQTGPSPHQESTQ